MKLGASVTDDRLAVAGRFGLDPRESQLAIRRFNIRRELGLRDKCSFEDFVGAYAAGLRAADDPSVSPAGLFFREVPDVWRRVMDALGIPRDEMYPIVAAFRARADGGVRSRASFSDFAGAFVAGSMDGRKVALREWPLYADQQRREGLPLEPPGVGPDWAEALLPDYAAWNDAITKEIFNAESAGRPVYLAVDTEFLQRVAERRSWDVASAEESFLRAVRPLVTPGAKHYARTIQHANAEATSVHTPPFIGVLALTALAATKMVGDETFAPHNYYGRLGQLLGRRSDAGQGFDEVDDAWKALDVWLDRTYRGQLGRSTARPLGRLTHVGYPISQALLRERDRRILPAFFRWGAFSLGDEIPAEDLAPLLLEWSESPACRLSHLGRRSVTDVQSRPYVAQIVARELELWSGELEAEEGARQRVARAWLGIFFEGGTRVSLYAISQRPVGFPDVLTVETPDLGKIDVHAVGEESDWYKPIRLIAVPVARQKWPSPDTKFAVAFEPVPVAACIPDEELGCYRQVPRLQLYEPALVLALPEWASRVRAVLDESGRAGFKEGLVPGLPAGSVAFRDVQIEKPLDIREPELACLAPAAKVGVSLAGGLRLGPGNWLTLGEPTLHVRPRGQKEEIEVWADGQLIANLPAEGGSLDLREYELPPGPHEVKVGERTLTFTTRDGRDPPGPRSGWRPITSPLRRVGRLFEPAPDVPANGSDLGLGIVRVRGAAVAALDEGLLALAPP